MKDRLYLIGFMASGKSSLGRKLAETINYEWIDLDQTIIAQEKRSIASIFERDGEAYFRTLESKILQKTIGQKKAIISTGGGIVMLPNHCDFLKQNNTLYLKWNFETLYARLVGDTKRPLAKNVSELLELYHFRQKLYEQSATYIIECEGKTKNEIISEMQRWMEEKGENSNY